MRKPLSQASIPTFLGVGILVAGLVAGVVFIGTGPGIFAPRASPQTTPKLVKMTNLTDTSFTVTFMTDEATAGFIKYGTSANDLKLQASDDRDQLSGAVGEFSTHHITAKFLQPDTEYFFTLGTASGARFDNEGSPYKLKTAKKSNSQAPAKTAYGSVKTAGGTPADGALVYIGIPGAKELSTYVKSSGSWSISLNMILGTDGTRLTPNGTDPVTVVVQGTTVATTTRKELSMEELLAAPLSLAFGGAAGGTSSTTASPTVGQGGSLSESVFETQQKTATASANATASASVSDPFGGSTTASGSASASVTTGYGMTGDMGSATSSANATNSATATGSATAQVPIETVVNTTVEEAQVVHTTQPVITGQAPPNTKIRIEIHSDEAIVTQVTTDANGGFEVQLEELKKTLSPGEHTVTITYTDPRTGQEVTETRTFTVESPPSGGGSLLAMASPSPYGTGNPYASPSPSPSPSASATGSSKTAGMPSTRSAQPVSGTFDFTLSLLFMGGLFIAGGWWSYRASKHWLTTEES